MISNCGQKPPVCFADRDDVLKSTHGKLNWQHTLTEHLILRSSSLCLNSSLHGWNFPLRHCITSCLQIHQLHINAANLLFYHVPKVFFTAGDCGELTCLMFMKLVWDLCFVTRSITLLEVAIRRWWTVNMVSNNTLHTFIISIIIPPPAAAAWSVDTRQVGSMDSCSWLQTLTLQSEASAEIHIH